MLKLTISEFFKRLISNIWRRSHEITLITIRWFLLATFVAVVIADLTECTPLHRAWQVVPDPGPRCRQGYVQLITMGTADVMTDLMLVFFPISIIVTSQMAMKRKIQLVMLFAGSLLPAGTTLFRIPNIIDRNGSQQYRSLLASVEILFATAIANALVLGSFVRDKGVKKQRWKFGSLSDSIERTASRRGTTIRHWGSDEDLVRDLGLGVDRELRGPDMFVPRPAPMATPGIGNGNTIVPPKAGKLMGPMSGTDEWQFPKKSSGSNSNITDDDLDLIKLQPEDFDRSPGEISSINSPRKVSFFDVGGLLEEDIKKDRRVSSTRTEDSGESSMHGALTHYNSHPTPNSAANFWSNDTPLSPAPPRKGSAVLLQDIGGLLGPPTSSNGNGSRFSRTNNNNNNRGIESRGYELKDMLREEGYQSQSQYQQQPGNRPASPMSKAKLRSAFEDLPPPPNFSRGPTSHPSLSPPALQSSRGLESVNGSGNGNALQRHPTAMSLQDVGGLLK